MSTMGTLDLWPDDAHNIIHPKQHNMGLHKAFVMLAALALFAVPLSTPGSKAGSVASAACQTAESISKATQSFQKQSEKDP